MHKIRIKRGIIIIDVIIAIFCICIFSISIIRIFKFISIDREKYKENEKIIDIIEKTDIYIRKSSRKSDIDEQITYDDFTVFINLDKEINNDVYKYEIVIKKDDIFLNKFYIFKIFEE